MRWLGKRVTTTDDTRITEKFLIIPRRVKGQWRWLERSAYKQQWIKYNNSPTHYWANICWVTKGEI